MPKEREMKEALDKARCPGCGCSLTRWEHPVAVLVIKRESEAAQNREAILVRRSFDEGVQAGYKQAMAPPVKGKR